MSTSLHFFTIPALTPAQAQAELNQFLLSHRVVNIEKQWVANGAASFWSLCLTVLEGPGPLPPALRAPGQGGQSSARTNTKVDYREVLSEPDFAAFAELRNLRASLAHLLVRAHVSCMGDMLCCCGFRVRPGVALASSCKLSRYQKHTATLELACRNGINDGKIQCAKRCKRTSRPLAGHGPQQRPVVGAVDVCPQPLPKPQGFWGAGRGWMPPNAPQAAAF